MHGFRRGGQKGDERVRIEVMQRKYALLAVRYGVGGCGAECGQLLMLCGIYSE